MSLLIRPSQVASVPLNMTLPMSLMESVTETTVTNTTVETTVATMSLPGGILGTNNILLIATYGILTNTSGAQANPQIFVRYAAANCGSCSIFGANGITNQGTYGLAYLKGNGATNAQKGAVLTYGDPTQTLGATSTAAIDSTVAQTLTVTFKWGSALTTLSYTHLYTSIIYLKAT